MSTLFPSYFLGGFDASTHRVRDGRRLDQIRATGHDRFVRDDYRRLADIGIRAARDGVRWTLVEPRPGAYDFAAERDAIRAANEAGVEVIWDLMHFGWPDHVDIFSADFPRRFGELAFRFAEVLQEEGAARPAVIPIHEIGYVAVAGGEAGTLNPFAHRRGNELRRQLVTASLAAARATRAMIPEARIFTSEALLHVEARRGAPHDTAAAEAQRQTQFETLDRLTGRVEPELGGTLDLIDGIGLSYFANHQWWYPGGEDSRMTPASAGYRPLHAMLREWHERYGKPLFISATGIENEDRPAWLATIGSEARAALRLGVDLQGICLYPILNHPAWNHDRHCRGGLWDYADSAGRRPIYEPLAEELERQQSAFQRPMEEEAA